MNVTVATEAHFRRTPDGRIWTDTGTNGYAFWRRYLDTFDTVTVLARVSDATIGGAAAVEGDRVRVRPLTAYTGLGRLPAAYPRLRRQIAAAAAEPGRAFVARVPGMVGTLLTAELRRRSHPYGVEVVGDPHDVFAAGLAPVASALFARAAARQLRQQCANATAAAYVTERVLQQRYAPGPATFTTSYSSIELALEAYAAGPRLDDRDRDRDRWPRLVTVGTQSQLYKGHDVLIEAVRLLHARGVPVTVRIVGSGRFRQQLEEQAAATGVGESIVFVGELPAGAAVRAELDAADLFVLPSRAEGLPRALLEAMARGLPCVATRVGGVPELLADDVLVPRDDPAALADTIAWVLTRPSAVRHELSAQNLRVARSFAIEVLRERAREFRRQLRSRTAAASRPALSRTRS